MFRPYMWAIFRLQSNFSGSLYRMCGVFFGYWGLGVGRGGGEISFVSVEGTMGIGLLQVDYHSFSLYTCQSAFLFLCLVYVTVSNLSNY